MTHYTLKGTVQVTKLPTEEHTKLHLTPFDVQFVGAVVGGLWGKIFGLINACGVEVLQVRSDPVTELSCRIRHNPPHLFCQCFIKGYVKEMVLIDLMQKWLTC